MIASDDASVASKDDKIDRQKEWRTKMKEEAKRSAHVVVMNLLGSSTH